MSSDNDNEADVWSGMCAQFEIVGARIVATIGHDGGAIVENVRRLFCSEGRIYSLETDGAGAPVHQLEYNFSFSGADESDPMASMSVEGRIVISGNHTNGHRMEIRGTGWIGYNEAGVLEGRFDRPPVIITDNCAADAEDGAPEADTDRRSTFGFPMPPQFMQATVRVPSNEWDDLDI